MDIAVFISIAVMVVIAGIEIFCLFCCSKARMKAAPVIAVIPVTEDDCELDRKLEYMAVILSKGSSELDKLILLDISSSPEQIRLCSEFCRSYSWAETLSLSELQKKLPEMFAIKRKT
jgi:hypothetical protein